MVWMEIIIELRKFHNAQKKIRTNIFENWDSLSTHSFYQTAQNLFHHSSSQLNTLDWNHLFYHKYIFESS